MINPVESSNPMVVVIVLNWNGKADTIECLKSLNLVQYPNLKITVVDNGSSDDSVESIAEAYPETDILETGMNLGYTGGNNCGIRRAVGSSAEFVLLLNNDTRVEPAFLPRLVSAMQTDARIGIAGPTVYEFPPSTRINATGGRIRWKTGKLVSIGLRKSRNEEAAEYADVDYASGSCLLVRTRVFEDIGYLDEDFFAHWEEIDFCTRAKRRGYRVVWVKRAMIFHKDGGSSSKVLGFRAFHNARNRIWFMKKNARPLDLLTFLFYLVTFDFWFLVIIALMVEDKGGLKGLLTGTVRGIWRRPGADKGRDTPDFTTWR